MRGPGWVVLLVVCGMGCAGTDGSNPPGGGNGDPIDDTGAPDDTGEPVVPEVIVTVCSDGSCDFLTVQSGVDGAPEGAVVELSEETFSETVVIDGRTLTLRGTGATTLDGGGTARGLEVASTAGPTEITVEGVAITNGNAERGGGVWCEGATLNLVDTTIRGGSAQEGGGIATRDCTVSMLRTQLLTNRAGGDGGGGYIAGGTLTVVDSLFATNVGADGGGLYITGAAGSTSGSTFEDNHGHVGGGVRFDAAYTFTHNIVRRNTGEFTGGGLAGILHSGEISYNEVYDNTGGSDGGGAFTESGSGHIFQNTFTNNYSTDDAGGLRMLYGAALIEDNTFVANVAGGGDGGAIKNSHAASRIVNNVFEDNQASGDGGAIEVDDDNTFSSGNVYRRNTAESDGGAVHLALPFWNIELHDSVFEDNVAGGCGGGIGFDGELHELKTSHLVMTGNQASSGGGMCVRDGTFKLENAIFSGNVASSAGGGIFFQQASLALYNVVLTGNAASNGSALALRSVGSTLVSDSILTGNDGNAVEANPSSEPTWRYTLTWGNTGDEFVGMSDPGGSDGNVSADPKLATDFHLSPTSPGINAGDPARVDSDGSRADMGAFGGPSGAW